MIVLVAMLMALVVAVGLVPLGLWQRYRAGTSRRFARRWLATLNAVGLSFSALLFVAGAAVTSLWAPNAWRYALAGLAGGCLLGLVGLALTRWERTPGSLSYTPNRFLAVVITLLVATRLAYGVWRMWQGWSSYGNNRTWLIESGIPGSLFVGAIVLGYTLAFWVGVSYQAGRNR